MGRLFLEHLEGRYYVCKGCGCHLAGQKELVSKLFHSRQGRAFLFNEVVNVCVGQSEERIMTTGLHEVADLFCKGCETLCGWRYETAHEESQKYKEGKSILERSRIDVNADKECLFEDHIDALSDLSFLADHGELPEQMDPYSEQEEEICT